MKTNYVFNGRVYGRIEYDNSKTTYYANIPSEWMNDDLSVDLTDATILEHFKTKTLAGTPVMPFRFVPITRKERSELLRKWESALNSSECVVFESTFGDFKVPIEIIRDTLMRDITTLL